MKSVVLIKCVPDTASLLQLNGDDKSMLAEGLEFIINPCDEFALEAFRLKEANRGDVVAVGVGDPFEIVPVLIDGLNCHVSNRVAVEAVH